MGFSSLDQFLLRLRTRRGFSARKILLIVMTLIMAWLVLPNIAMVLFSAVRSTEKKLPFEATTYSLTNLVNVFGSEVTYRLLLNTTIYAIGTIIVGLGLAIAFAWFLERTNVPFRRIMFVLVLAPMGIPMIIISMAWVLLANPVNGMFNVALRSIFGMSGPGPVNVYTMAGMILVTGLSIVPMIYLMVSGVFSRMDPALEEAARMNGAGNWATFWQVTFPLLAPAILAAAIYFIVRTIEIFEFPAMLGMPRKIFVFSSMIYYYVNPVTSLPDYGRASAYGLVLLMVALVLTFIYSRYLRNPERFATVTGKGFRPRLIDLGKWKFVPVILMSGYFFFAVVMPLFVLIWTSLAPRFTAFSIDALHLLNLNAYRKLLGNADLWIAVKNTFTISFSATVIGMLIATLVSWLSVRGGMKWALLPERIMYLVLGVPGVVLCLALMFTYVSIPIPIYGTIWIIVLGFVIVSLPFGSGLMNGAFLQIHKQLEEAAAVSGAGLWATFTQIALPLLKTSFGRGALWMFVRNMRDTTIALMLFSVGNQTIAVLLWYLWMEDSNFSAASAIAVPLVLITIGLTFLLARQTMLVGEKSKGDQ
jgi:iron(III) transport system permease protein